MREILQVVTDTDRRGAQVFAAELQPVLGKAGYRVRTEALTNGRTMNQLPLPVLGGSRLGIATLAALRRAIRRTDVVVGFGSSTLPACVVAGTGIDTPFVYRSIGDIGYWANTLARRARVRALLHRAAIVVALWEGAARSLCTRFAVPQSRVRVIPRGVPAGAFPNVEPARRAQARAVLGLAPDRPTVVYLGSLTPEKNVAAAILSLRQLPEVQLLVAGDGPERGELERLAERAAAGRVRFAGVVAQPTVALGAADALVLPSHSEGMSGALIEAGLSGVPAVATEVGASAEVICDGITGRIVPAPANPSALADALRDVLDHAPAYGPAARQRCLERFEISVVADAWHGLFSSMG